MFTTYHYACQVDTPRTMKSHNHYYVGCLIPITLLLFEIAPSVLSGSMQNSPSFVRRLPPPTTNGSPFILKTSGSRIAMATAVSDQIMVAHNSMKGEISRWTGTAANGEVQATKSRPLSAISTTSRLPPLFSHGLAYPYYNYTSGIPSATAISKFANTKPLASNFTPNPAYFTAAIAWIGYSGAPRATTPSVANVETSSSSGEAMLPVNSAVPSHSSRYQTSSIVFTDKSVTSIPSFTVSPNSSPNPTSSVGFLSGKSTSGAGWAHMEP